IETPRSPPPRPETARPASSTGNAVAVPATSRPAAKRPSAARTGARGPRASVQPPAATTPIREVAKYDAKARPYELTPPSAVAATGIAVDVARASKAISETRVRIATVGR